MVNLYAYLKFLSYKKRPLIKASFAVYRFLSFLSKSAIIKTTFIAIINISMKKAKNFFIYSLIAIIALVGGLGLSRIFSSSNVVANTLNLDDQEATIRAINGAAPGVVSITVSGNVSVDVIDPNTGATKTETQKVKIGAGSGFLISSDGLIITNKHVTAAGGDEATNEYKITFQSGKEYYAQLIGDDPVDDLAIMKIFDKNLPYLQIGDSNSLTTGTTVIAIGNALGRYNNTATKGIVSGLGRSLLAADSNGNPEELENVIQTDAQINPGNSGGPLIGLDGKVIGINVAKDEGGESIGFAIPINEAKPVIESARKSGRIIRARLGVSYLMITSDIATLKKLSRSTGALVYTDTGPAVIDGSPAALAGIQSGDIIFEIDGKKIDERLPLQSYISQFSPGKKLGLKIQRDTQIFTKIVTLDELK
jgi:serine protease Do